jgi:hypothetical protein
LLIASLETGYFQTVQGIVYVISLDERAHPWNIQLPVQTSGYSVEISGRPEGFDEGEIQFGLSERDSLSNCEAFEFVVEQ